MTVVQIVGTKHYAGLAADAKPSSGVFPGSTYYEYDTGTTFQYLNGAWIEQIQNPIEADTGVVTVVGFNAPVEVSVTTSGAYAAGDCVGGKIALSGALRTDNDNNVMPGILHSLVLKDYGAGTANLMVGFFKSDPVQGTYTDNAAVPSLATSTNDADKLVAVREIASSDWKSFGSITTATLGGLGIVIPPGASTAYTVVIQCVATPSFASGTLKLVAGFLPD